MENLSIPQKYELSRYTHTRHTCSNNDVNAGESRASATVTLRQRASYTSTNTRNNTRNSWWSLEILYNVTDIVLGSCGVLVVLAGIAHLAGFGYALYWAKSY